MGQAESKLYNLTFANKEQTLCHCINKIIKYTNKINNNKIRSMSLSNSEKLNSYCDINDKSVDFLTSKYNFLYLDCE